MKKPQAPGHLNETALKEWDDVWECLEKGGKVEKRDVSMVAAYCAAMGTYIDAQNLLNAKGYIIPDAADFPKPHPFVKIANDALATANRIALNIGITAKGRIMLKAKSVVKKAKVTASPFATFLN